MGPSPMHAPRFNENEQFQKNRAMLNGLLGLTRPEAEEAAQAKEEEAALALDERGRGDREQLGREGDGGCCSRGHPLRPFRTDHGGCTCVRLGVGLGASRYVGVAVGSDLGCAYRSESGVFSVVTNMSSMGAGREWSRGLVKSGPIFTNPFRTSGRWREWCVGQGG